MLALSLRFYVIHRHAIIVAADAIDAAAMIAFARSAIFFRLLLPYADAAAMPLRCFICRCCAVDIISRY